jgi:hypothetical protein
MVKGKQYDISELVYRLSFKDNLNDGCGKLEFTYKNQDMDITNGSVVSFIYDASNIFYGYVFRVNKNKDNDISVTAYDQLRYCKFRDTVVISGDTVTTLVVKMCSTFKLKKGTLTETGYKLATDVKDDTTWLDIIYSGIKETKKNKGKQYVLRDEYGVICIRNTEDLQLNLILGDKSLVYDFTYDKTIDDKTYNQIKLRLPGNGESDSKFITQKDDDSISRYGVLQYYEMLYNTNSSQAKEEAEELLKLYNREAETLTLSCLGDTRVRAGTSFYGKIEDIGYNKRLIVRSVTHNYLPIHTMEVEAML